MSSDMNNNKFEQNQEFLRKISETINNMRIPLQQVAIAANAASQAIVTALQSDAVQNALNFGQKIAQTIAKYDFAPMLKNLSEAMIPIRYIHLLEQVKWPLFLIDDKELRDQILSACAENEDANVVKEIAFAYCDEDFLCALEEDWLDCSAIKQDRKPILSEALEMHKKGYYHASVSALMCQIYGVASDIVDLAKKCGLEIDDDAKDFVSEHFEIKREDIDKEKGKLMQMVVMTESGQLLWDAMASYLKEEILCSSDSKKRWATQPLRNKICHGDQLNFGSKEHSLKSILSIDMLIQLAYEINRIIELDKKDFSENGEDEKE